MFVRPFGYVRAGSVDEACAVLRERGGGAKVIAGGQSLVPMMNLGLVEPEIVVDVSHIEGGDDLTEEDGFLLIGAMRRHRDLERNPVIGRSQPLLAAAARHVGNVRVRNRGTLGGSLAHNDPAAELPLVMTLLEATYELSNGTTSRTVPAADFPVSYFATQLAEDELLTAVRVPKLADGWGWGFREVSRRPGDFALVAAAALVRFDAGVVQEARLALTGVSDRPVRCPDIEAAIIGRRAVDFDATVGAIEGIDPVSDTSASAGYRRRLSRVLAVRALVDADGVAENAA